MTNHQIGFVKEKDMLYAIRLFIEKTNANYSGLTFYHGIDDILHGRIPQFFEDNLNEIKLNELENLGFLKQ